MEALRHYRRLRGLSQRRLAEDAGVGVDTINQIENGHREPRGDTLRKLAGALGVDVADLYSPVASAEDVPGGFTAVFQRDGGWWIGYVEELPGANAQERTLEEARESLREAVSDVLEANRELTRTEFEGRDVVREPLLGTV